MAERTITHGQIETYAEISTDRNPLHVDKEVAAESHFGGIVAHGFLLLNDAMHEIRQRLNYPIRFSCTFVGPGRPGEVIDTGVDASDDGRLSIKIQSSGKLLVEGEASS